ncbi:NIPSNAP family protein [Ruegeria atlantica]|uniref:NIPSNAP family protein n=1 Tax=Ruegeria atlantica TaxID=81569 RepID=UPI00147CDFE6|nr:NIPSNAP family protein [Ruegeria atlantica]
MITCFVRYELNPETLDAFENYARMWLPLVERYGGNHHGYFLPHESANDLAVTLFSFPSLAAYEEYRTKSREDPACIAAYDYAEKTQCIRRYDRQFLRPVLADY